LLSQRDEQHQLNMMWSIKSSRRGEKSNTMKTIGEGQYLTNSS